MSSPARSSRRSKQRRQLAALVALLGAATAAGTFLQGALSVLSSYVIDEFGITRSQLGLVFMAFSVTGGLFSPMMGRYADRSIRRVMGALFIVAAAGLLIASSATGLALLVVAAVIGGLGLAAGNPATNKIVSQRISIRRRGIVIGLKQSGPPLGLLIAGLLLPPLASALGWRWALAITAAMPLAGLVATRLLVADADEPEAASTQAPQTEAERRSSGRAIGYLAVIGLLIAMGAAGLIAFVPLFAQEAVGLSSSVAGLLAALMGLAGVAARIGWGAAADRFSHASRPMIVLSVVAAFATVSIWAGTSAQWLLWIGVIASGFSVLAWHAVAWLALLGSVDGADVGRATGLVQFGNSIGFASGPPLTGYLIDSSGGYGQAWAVVTAIFVLATVLTVTWSRTAE